MKIINEIEEIETKLNSEILDITENVIKKVKDSGIMNGMLMIQPLHTTVGIYLNEGENFLFEDIIKHLEDKAPQIKNLYRHDNILERDCPPDEPENGHSHIKSGLYSNPSIVIGINQGKIVIGKYQRILFAEFDGPCPRKHKSKRKIFIQIMGN